MHKQVLCHNDLFGGQSLAMTRVAGIISRKDAYIDICCTAAAACKCSLCLCHGTANLIMVMFTLHSING